MLIIRFFFADPAEFESTKLASHHVASTNLLHFGPAQRAKSHILLVVGPSLVLLFHCSFTCHFTVPIFSTPEAYAGRAFRAFQLFRIKFTLHCPFASRFSAPSQQRITFFDLFLLEFVHFNQCFRIILFEQLLKFVSLYFLTALFLETD